ncbi:unnamed protein product [Trichobilharzia regenti]|nr:unnamed protein product [Trichobilharzia regenti]
MVGDNLQEVVDLDFVLVGTHYQGASATLKELMSLLRFKPASPTAAVKAILNGGHHNSYITPPNFIYHVLFKYIHIYIYFTDICLLKPEPGLCRAYFPSFYYDPSSNECKSFVYGGCGGNENRFASKETCEETCKLD